MDSGFLSDARKAGFTEEQADFMWEFLALVGHNHEINEVGE